MLMLGRNVGQRIMIGDDIVILVSRMSSTQVILGIEAPPNVSIHREEIKKILDSQKRSEDWGPSRSENLG